MYAEDLSTNGCQWLPKLQCLKKPYIMGKGNAFLLSDGDRILLSDGTSFVFVSSSSITKLPQVVESDELQGLEKDVRCFFYNGLFEH